MKTTSMTSHLLAGLLLAGALTLSAAGKIEGGPKGGRLLEKTEPRAEFVVERDRTVSIHFYNGEMQPVAATTQAVTVVADGGDGKTKLEFEKRGDSLASKTKLPEGDGYMVVVQFRPSADAKPMNLRFKLDLHTCGGCRRAEYACTCGH